MAYENLEQQEDVWNEDEYGGEILSHTFEGEKCFFRLDFGTDGNDSPFVGVSFYPDKTSLQKADSEGLEPEYIFPRSDNTIVLLKTIIDEHIEEYLSMNELAKNMDQYFSRIIEANKQEKANESPEIQLAKKVGYVQGVCECVAALGGDRTLGKKLLTEMNVTKDMAKKYANPETYKALEQGIFAPQQKLEQTHSIKR